jgi:F-type H+-transporting ATPase subunit alpha
VEEQVSVIYTGINGFLDDVPVTEVRSFLAKFRAYLRSSAGSLLSTIKSEQKLSPESEESLKKAIADAKATL